MAIREVEERPALPEPQGDDDEGLDLQRIREMVGFALRAPRRRKRAAAITLIVGLSLTIFALKFWPRTYGTEVRILSHHNFLLPALGNPTRAVPREAD